MNRSERHQEKNIEQDLQNFWEERDTYIEYRGCPKCWGDLQIINGVCCECLECDFKYNKE